MALTAFGSLLGVGIYTWTNIDASLRRLDVGRRRLEGIARDDVIDV